VHHGFDNRGKWLNPQRIYGERKIRLPEVVVVVIVVLVMMVIMVEVMVTVVMVTGGEGRQWRKAISEGRWRKKRKTSMKEGGGRKVE
jgi:uncharacterized protein HemY